ncbi:MAG: TlpA disulfide reductase family protein [Bacteroidota bacterium]|nr:TlpA disulfide reductase family protein [Bacteroidota bacterium]
MMILQIVLCLAFMAVGLVTMYLVLRRNRYPIPADGVQWIVTIMSVLLICASGFILALAFAYRADEVNSAAELDEPAEDFAFRLVSSQEDRHLAQFRGQVVLLNFWATWCQPCITEIPELDRLQRAYRDQGLVVMTISDEPLEDLNRFEDLWPKETVSGYLEFEALPEGFQSELMTGRPISYIIDRGGVIRELVIGAGSFEYFERLVKPWLDRV